MRKVKLMVLAAGLLVCSGLGVLAAVAWSPEASVTEGAVERVRHGVTETGQVQVVTTEGQVRRVIRWKTKQEGIETQTLQGPLRLRTRGSMYVARPATGSAGLHPESPGLLQMRVLGGTTTLPAATVLETVTETLQDTTTVFETVTVTTETGSTETGPTETGTGIPTPP
jgi:hypothetical protein